MANEPESTQNPESPAQPLPGTDEGTDWKAKYEEMQKHSRTWEDRAKANKHAAEELEQLKASQMSVEEQAAAYKKQLDEIQAERQQVEWKAKVSKATGVPAEVLRGSTEEEITTHAAALKAILSPAKPKGPEVSDPFAQPEGHKTTPLGDFAQRVFGTKR